jgi:2-oxoglutarate ferredoxin oxidoreductase subunit delta
MSSAPETAKLNTILINERWCKGCGICVSLCPKTVFSMRGSLPSIDRIEACTACGICEQHCPDFAITVISHRKRGDAA